MKYALIDDDTKFHETFTEIAKDYIEPFDINCFFSAEAFLESLEKNKSDYNVLFVDIEMSGMSGIEMSRLISLYGLSGAFVVYITSRTEYVYDAFGINVIRYVYKPEFKEKASSLFRDINDLLDSQQMFAYKVEDSIIKVKKADIISCVKDLRKIVIYTNNYSYQTNFKSLNDVINSLDSNYFVLINRSVIVNVNHIVLIKSDKAVMSNRLSYAISSTRLSEVKTIFKKINSMSK